VTPVIRLKVLCFSLARLHPTRPQKILQHINLRQATVVRNTDIATIDLSL
jgi:hypothetical protein